MRAGEFIDPLDCGAKRSCVPNLHAAFDRAVTRDLKLAADIAAPLFLFNYWHRGAPTGGWYERTWRGRVPTGSSKGRFCWLLRPATLMSICMIAYIKARVGDRDGARDLIRESTKRERRNCRPP